MQATDNYQGVAVMNFTDRETPYTRIIEHKHFVHGTQPETIITREYPMTWTPGAEPYYPVNDARNSALYQKYQEKPQSSPRCFSADAWDSTATTIWIRRLSQL